jgi:tyrosyl-tRNA synthetase
MNEMYYMGLVNYDNYSSNNYYNGREEINYPQYAYDRENNLIFTSENEGFLKGNIEKNTYKPYKNYRVGDISVNGDKINDLEFVITKSTTLGDKYIVIRRGKKQYYLVKYA